MTAADLVAELRERGIELRTEKGRLLFRPKNLDEGTRARLQAVKPGVIALLEAEARAHDDVLPHGDRQLLAALRHRDEVDREMARAPRTCPACGAADQWLEAPGNRLCRRCHPPTRAQEGA
jgi:hypothetical protein